MILMKDWKDYIDQKFVPKEDYDFEQEDYNREYAGKELVESIIKVTHKKTKTYFEFLNAYGDWETLYVVRFGNPKTKCCPDSSIFEEGPDDELVSIMNEFLKPALAGWTAEEYYLYDEYSRSRYWGGGRLAWVWPNKGGCLFKLFNLTRIMDLLFYLKIIGDVKRVVIEPIKSPKKL